MKIFIFFLLCLFLTKSSYSQISNKEGIYTFSNGEHKLTIAIMPKDSSRYHMWTIMDSAFQWEVGSLHIAKNEGFYYYSAGKAYRNNSTCIVEGTFVNDMMVLSYFDTICFQYRFKSQVLQLHKIFSKIDSSILIKEVYLNNDVHSIIRKTPLYRSENATYTKLDTMLLPDTRVISNFKDQNGFRYIKFVDSNRNFVEGYVRDEDVTPLPKVVSRY